MPDVMDAISVKLGDPVRVSFPEYLFYCPFCFDRIGSEDRSGHLYVNEEDGYFCHRCQARGSTRWLLRVLGVSPDEIRGPVPDLVRLRQRLIAGRKSSGVRLDSRDAVERVELPVNTDYPWNMPEVWSYVMKRGLSRFECEYYGLMGWIDDRNEYRLVFPDRLKGELVFWQARACRDGVKPKYDSPKGPKKSLCVWNIDNVDPDRPIYVCEGILSARACGRNGVAIYGKYLSRAQRSLIARRAKSGVRVVLDGGAWKNTIKAAELFLRSRVEVGVVMLPPKTDPDELRKEDSGSLTKMLLESEPLTDVGILKLKVDYL